MALAVDESGAATYKEGALFWVGFGIILAALVAFTFDGLREMVEFWGNREEYSYGYLVPFITLYLLWQNKDRIEKTPFPGSWAGIPVLVVGIALGFVGNASATSTLIQYGFFVSLIGILLSLTGRNGFRPVIVPVLFLWFMIPLPGIVLFGLSAKLQLLSSEIGVAIIRLFGISVYLEGNVIDLGTYKLQVVEACSGLRYLFPLMSLAFICAYFFQAPFWKRAVVFLSSAPITVFMNSFRIGVIGVLVDNWGTEQAEGFLHYFEGWVVFMACIAILLGEMWLLSRIGDGRKPFRDVFSLSLPPKEDSSGPKEYRRIPGQLIVAVAILALGAVGSALQARAGQVIPERQDFSRFPLMLGEWRGATDRLEPMYLDLLHLDDYLLANYVKDGEAPVNLYVAYYASQQAGEAAHSPRSCIPGGGWDITNFTKQKMPNLLFKGEPLEFNRALIRKGDDTQLVYYWFPQRGRIVANEYLIKWYLFLDAVRLNRTDGALVRLTTPVTNGENIEKAESRLQSFAKLAQPQLGAFIPE